MKRRIFIKNVSGLIGAFSLLPLDEMDLFPSTFYSEGEVVKFQIGDIHCTVFRDTLFKYHAKDFFINTNPEELQIALNKYRIADGNIPSPFIALLLQQKDKKILIDTGVGFAENPVNVRGTMVQFKGKLHQLLEKENIRRDDITDVIITHFHPDHIGGIYSEAGQLNFPNARFYMHGDEWEFWHSSRSVNQPQQFHYFVEKNITRLKGQNLQLVKGDFTQLFTGLTAIKADGHTPGQIALAIQSGNEQLLYISDAFLHPLHIERTDWQTNYDLDHDQAKRTRIKLAELAYKENMLVNAFHFDFPGLGNIGKTKNKWDWNYNTPRPKKAE
ncbi:MAG TPA: MBL fold metallo-hydrolase [Chitinophagaceae bacterium]